MSPESTSPAGSTGVRVPSSSPNAESEWTSDSEFIPIAGLCDDGGLKETKPRAQCEGLLVK